MDYVCVLLTCLTQSRAHEFFEAADAQKEVNVSLYSHALQQYNSGAQAQAVVTAQSHSRSNGIACAAYACSGAVHCGLVFGLYNRMLCSSSL